MEEILVSKYGNNFSMLMERLKQYREYRLAGKADLLLEPKESMRMELDGMISIEGVGYFETTDFALKQIGQEYGIPSDYVSRMKAQAESEDNYTLLAQNFNYWINRIEMGTKLVRTLPVIEDRHLTERRKIIAFLSNQFKPIDNYDVANTIISAVASRVPTDNLVFHHAYVTETEFSMTLYDTSRKYYIHPESQKDGYFIGLNVKNSEVGTSSLILSPSLIRQVCSNGLIVSEPFMIDGNGNIEFGSRIKIIHRGKRITNTGSIWSNATIQLLNATTLSQIQDVINATFDPDNVEIMMERLRETEKKPISPTWIDLTQHALGLTGNENEAIWKKVEENTRYGFIQAVTSYANDLMEKKPERASELQKLGWQLTSERYWKEIEDKEKAERAKRESKNEQ